MPCPHSFPVRTPFVFPLCKRVLKTAVSARGGDGHLRVGAAAVLPRDVSISFEQCSAMENGSCEALGEMTNGCSGSVRKCRSLVCSSCVRASICVYIYTHIYLLRRSLLLSGRDGTLQGAASESPGGEREGRAGAPPLPAHRAQGGPAGTAAQPRWALPSRGREGRGDARSCGVCAKLLALLILNFLREDKFTICRCVNTWA